MRKLLQFTRSEVASTHRRFIRIGVAGEFAVGTITGHCRRRRSGCYRKNTESSVRRAEDNWPASQLDSPQPMANRISNEIRYDSN